MERRQGRQAGRQTGESGRKRKEKRKKNKRKKKKTSNSFYHTKNIYDWFYCFSGSVISGAR